MKQQSCTLDERLQCAADFVRDNAVVADIGTDHAYLPIYLLTNDRIKFAVASDINRGPLDRAKKNAAQYSVDDKMDFILSDGLCGINPDAHGVTDIVICGMGGELITKIIDDSPYTRTKGVRLILQPMTFSDKVRYYLASNGFDILDERLCEASGKIYTCILAEYDGGVRNFTQAELLLGKIQHAEYNPLFKKMTDQIIKRLQIKIEGMKKGDLDTAFEESCLSEIIKLTSQKQTEEKDEHQ